MNYQKLSKVVSHALRHKPHQYGIQLDKEGWTSLRNLVKGVKDIEGLEKTKTSDIMTMINLSKKRRHEVVGNKIRAIYGHSVQKVSYEEITPTTVFYHGTSNVSVEQIMKSGLKPMERQYVHLSSTRETAYKVGLRKSKKPIILMILAEEASQNGIKFFKGKEDIYLSDNIPPQFITITETDETA